jgi:ABC-type Mn2+/Zn2+ transport system permease subunit
MITFFQTISDFWHYEFLLRALIATISLSLVAGVLSPIIVTKRYSFMGAAVSHSTLFGLSISLSLFANAAPYLHFTVTLLITLIFALILAWKSHQEELPTDSLIGIFFSIMMALGIIVYSLSSAEQGDLISFLFGNILLLSTFDVVILLIISLLVMLAILIKLPNWIYWIVDPLGARLNGIKVTVYHYLLFILMTTVIITSIKLAGTVLVTTLLIIPGVFALRSTRGIKAVFIYSTLFSLLSSTLGLVIANWLNTPSGATLALTQFVLLSIWLISSKTISLLHNS